MGWRIQITWRSYVCYRKSQIINRWCHERIFLIKISQHLICLRLSFIFFHQTLQSLIHQKIMEHHLQIIILNHRLCPSLSWWIRSLKSCRHLWRNLRKNRWFQRNRKKRLWSLGKRILNHQRLIVSQSWWINRRSQLTRCRHWHFDQKNQRSHQRKERLNHQKRLKISRIWC